MVTIKTVAFTFNGGESVWAGKFRCWSGSTRYAVQSCLSIKESMGFSLNEIVFERAMEPMKWLSFILTLRFGNFEWWDSSASATFLCLFLAHKFWATQSSARLNRSVKWSNYDFVRLRAYVDFSTTVRPRRVGRINNHGGNPILFSYFQLQCGPHLSWTMIWVTRSAWELRQQ